MRYQIGGRTYEEKLNLTFRTTNFQRDEMTGTDQIVGSRELNAAFSRAEFAYLTGLMNLEFSGIPGQPEDLADLRVTQETFTPAMTEATDYAQARLDDVVGGNIPVEEARRRALVNLREGMEMMGMRAATDDGIIRDIQSAVEEEPRTL